MVLLGAMLAPSWATAASPPRVDWGTYGFSASRSGFNPSERALPPASLRFLTQRFSVALGGAIDAQPLVATKVRLPSGRRADVLYAGTEGGAFAALDAATGHLFWRKQLGAALVPGCPDLPSHLYGVTGTPAIDRSRNRVYVVAGNGRAYALDLATGRVERRWTITTDPLHEHTWGALTLERGTLYVPVAGLCDLAPYLGRVLGIDTVSRRRFATWLVMGGTGFLGGGIWGWGGVSADPTSGAIYAATGNALADPENLGLAEHVVRLTPKLHVKASNYPGLVGAGADADLAGAPMIYRAPDCPPQLVVDDKYGSLFVYDRNQIAAGPVQRIQLANPTQGANGHPPLISVAAYWLAKRMVYLSNPTDNPPFRHGIVAFRVTRSCRLVLAWQGGAGPNSTLDSSPTVASGVVYYGNGEGDELVALSASTGRLLWRSGAAVKGPIFNAPAVVKGHIYVGSWDGSLHAFASSHHPRR